MSIPTERVLFKTADSFQKLQDIHIRRCVKAKHLRNKTCDSYNMAQRVLVDLSPKSNESAKRLITNPLGQ